MPCRVCLVRRRRARCQRLVAGDRRPELFPRSQPPPPPRQVLPRQEQLPASHHARQGVMRRVEVFEHLVHSGRGHEPVGVLLCGAQPRRQGGLVLRGGDCCP